MLNIKCTFCTNDFSDWKSQELHNALCGKCTVGSLRSQINNYHALINSTIFNKLNDDAINAFVKLPFFHQRYISSIAEYDGMVINQIINNF